MDVDEKRPRLNSYGPPHNSSTHRMPPADPTSLHNYQSQPPAPPQPYGQPWAPPPSPYDSNDHRASHAHDIPHHPSSSGGPLHPFAPISREPSTYGPEYGRPASISGPIRSPGEVHNPPPHHHHSNGAAEDPQYHHPPHHSDYRARPSYGHPSESPLNGSNQQPLHVQTGPEVMSNHHGVPPAHHGYPVSAGPGPFPTGPMGYAPYGLYDGPNRRKPVRAAQACDSCRQRKSKCDEQRPTCTHCKDNNLKCTYREVPLQKQDKQALQMTEKLDAMDDRIGKVLQYLENQKTRMDTHEAQLDLVSSVLPPEKHHTYQAIRGGGSVTSGDTPPIKSEAPNRTAPTRSSSAVYEQESRMQRVASHRDEPDFSLPTKHTTPAQNILNWPSVIKLRPIDINVSYPMDIEKNRGLLRLYGCGEGEDKSDGGAGPTSPADSTASTSRSEDESSSPPGGVWGTSQLPPRSPSASHSTIDHAGGVSVLGGLLLDSHVVDKYHHSYLEHIHTLHPFLETRVLRDMVSRFKRRYSRDRLTMAHKATNPQKRKWQADGSPIPAIEHPSSKTPDPSRSVPIVEVERSITNAIVLLVLALGKICCHHTVLPAAVSCTTVSSSTPTSTPGNITSAPSSPFPGPAGRAILNPAMSGPHDFQGKNMDVFPGLAYYAVGSGILGDHAGGSDVAHIQANLLAGLYMGQLARVFPSYQYISNACRACQVLIES